PRKPFDGALHLSRGEPGPTRLQVEGVERHPFPQVADEPRHGLGTADQELARRVREVERLRLGFTRRDLALRHEAPPEEAEARLRLPPRRRVVFSEEDRSVGGYAAPAAGLAVACVERGVLVGGPE